MPFEVTGFSAGTGLSEQDQQRKLEARRKRSLMSTGSLLALAACGGGGGSTPVNNNTGNNTPAPQPDFTESPTNTFTARDNNNRTLNQGSATADLTVTGRGGNDTINTGSGNDTIEGGSGSDTINAGAGNDVIRGGEEADSIEGGDGNDLIMAGHGADTVLAGSGDDAVIMVGLTDADQYDSSAINSPAGSALDLSSLLTLDDINNRSASFSDLNDDDTVDGGDGIDTLVLYGSAQLIEIDISNFETLLLGSYTSLTVEQITGFSEVDGDGNSELAVYGYNSINTINLGQIALSDIGMLEFHGNFDVLISSVSEFGGASRVVAHEDGRLILDGGLTTPAEFLLGDFVGVTEGFGTFEVAAGQQLTIATYVNFRTLAEELEGEGTVVIAGDALNNPNLFHNVTIDDDLSFIDVNGNPVDVVADHGAILVPDIDQGDGTFATVEITPVLYGFLDGAGYDFHPVTEQYEDAGSVSFLVSLSARYFEDIVLDYELSDGTTGTITFLAGETEHRLDFALDDNDIIGDTTEISLIVTDPTGNHSVPANPVVMTILDDDEDPDGNPDLPDSAPEAPNYVVGDVLTSYLLTSNDRDWLTISMEEGNVYTFTITPSAIDGSDDIPSIAFWLNNFEFGYSYPPTYNSDGSRTLSIVAPETGNYQLEIYGDASIWELQSEVTETTEPDGQADFVASADTRGVLTTGESLEGTLSHGSDIDWFQLSLAEAQDYIVSLGGVDLPEDTVLRLVDASGESYLVEQYSQSIGAATSFVIQPSLADIVYAEVINTAGNTGSYTISFDEFSALEPSGDNDYRSSGAGTGQVAVDTVEGGSLGFVGDVDGWLVEARAGQQYTFQVSWDPTGLADGLSVSNLDNLLSEGLASYTTVSGAGSYEVTFIADQAIDLLFLLGADDSSDQVDYSVSLTRTGEEESPGVADYAASTETAGTIAVGGTATGNIGAEYDRDWFAIELEVGNTYQILLRGTSSGVGTLDDPRIEYIYDADGNAIPLTYNDDGGFAIAGAGDYESAMLFQPETSGTYYIAAGGWFTSTGTYELAVSDVSGSYPDNGLPYGPTNQETIPFTDFVEIDPDFAAPFLISGSRWSAVPDGSTTLLTYSFPSGNDWFSLREFSAYGNSSGLLDFEPLTIAALTGEQTDEVRSLLSYVSTIANLSFVEVAETDLSAGTLRFGWTSYDDGDNDNTLAWAYPPFGGPAAGDVWLYQPNMSPDVDSYWSNIVLHEIGHALGLKHPFENEGDGGVAPSYLDGLNWTVMSYTIHSDHPGAWSADLYPSTFMYYDILALQYLYGEAETNPGDTVYTFDANQRYYMTIWDTGGNDTIEFVNNNSDLLVNMSGGLDDRWIDVGTTVNLSTSGGTVEITETVYLPAEVEIENIIAGSGNDELIGGSADNTIDGGAGNDRIDGSTGDDTLIGGDGNDVFVFYVASEGETDTIVDFVDGQDLIHMVGRAFDHLTITQVGDDTHIEHGIGSVIILQDTDSSLITEDDFQF